VTEIVRAEIVSPPHRDPYYQVDNITAATLPGLCVKLLAAGFDPEGSVECYRPGRTAWDIRARSIRAVAAEHAAKEGSRDTAPLPRNSIPGAVRGLPGCSQKPPTTYKASNLVWQGLRLHLRVSDRTLAVLKPDANHPNLYRVCILDHLGDLTNLTRAREAAIALALETLNSEIAVKQAQAEGGAGMNVPATVQQAALDQCAEQIRFLGKRTVADLLEIGRLLDEVKHSGLGRAGFLQWIDHEFGWSEDTAERYIALQKLRRQLPQVADVSLPVSALYLLASPSTPLETAKDVVAKGLDGEQMSVAEIKATVTEAKGNGGLGFPPRSRNRRRRCLR
jgi:hypothetical protein